jgi:hypothetical protein
LLGVALFGWFFEGTPGLYRYLDLLLVAVGVLNVVFAFKLSRQPLMVISVDGLSLPAFLWWGPQSIPWPTIAGLSTRRGWLTVAPSDPADPMWHRTRRLKAKSRYGGDVPLPVSPLLMPARAAVLADLGAQFQRAALEG